MKRSESGGRRSGGKGKNDSRGFSGRSSSREFKADRPSRSREEGDSDRKPYSRSGDDRPARGNDRGEKRYSDRPSRPRSEGDSDRKPYSRSGDDRPSRGNDRGEKRYSDRPSRPRSEGDSDRKPYSRSGDDRPARGNDRGEKRYSERPSRPRSEGDSDRKPYSRSGDERPARGNDRGEKRYSDRPSRSREEGDSDRKPYSRSGNDRPARGNDRGAKRYSDRKSEGRSNKTYFSPEERPDENDEKPVRRNTRSDRGSTDRAYPKARRSDVNNSNDWYSNTERRPASRDEDPWEDKPKRNYSDRPEKRSRPNGDAYEKKSGSYGDLKGRHAKDKDDDRQSEKKHGRRDTRKEFSGRRNTTYQKPKNSLERALSANADPNTPIRLNRYISMAGICSRREADEMIKAGLFSVNGEVVTELGTKVTPGDDVRYNGERIRNEKLVYVLLNKPKDYITTADDPEGRKTVMELVADAGRERIYPVGRLDRNTTGLLLFTNDGDLTTVLTHPSSEVRKMYHVELDKNLKPGDMKKIIEGIELEDGFIQVDDIAFEGDGSDKSSIGVELHSGRNRIVRRMFEHLGYEVRKLDRVMFAGLTKKDLSRGRWRYLSVNEIAMLKMISGKSMKKKISKAE